MFISLINILPSIAMSLILYLSYHFYGNPQAAYKTTRYNPSTYSYTLVLSITQYTQYEYAAVQPAWLLVQDVHFSTDVLWFLRISYSRVNDDIRKALCTNSIVPLTRTQRGRSAYDTALCLLPFSFRKSLIAQLPWLRGEQYRSTSAFNACLVGFALALVFSVACTLSGQLSAFQDYSVRNGWSKEEWWGVPTVKMGTSCGMCWKPA